ncbi:MAG: T9SS type A sorting domain-containing protein, partial [Chitinophagales bacterium]
LYVIHQTTEGGYIACGSSYSGISGDKTAGVEGGTDLSDFWIVKMDNTGQIIWQNTIGGENSDYLKSAEVTADGGFIIGGTSSSNHYADKSESRVGYSDYWVIKLYPDCMPEICNAADDNCNGLIDDGITETINIAAGGPIIFCQGGSVLLTTTYSGTSVQWKKNGTNIAGATSSTYSVNKTGDYTCVTTSPCGTATSTLIHVTVNKNPAASITAGGATTFCAGGSVTLTEAAVAGSTYQWYKGASAIAGATSTNYIATTAGNYKCRVTKTASGCFKNSNTITVTVPCKNSADPDFHQDDITLEIYPNPNDGTFTINALWPLCALCDNNTSIIEIYNSLGQIIYSQNIHSSNGNINETISIDNLSSGIYFVRICSASLGNNGKHYSQQKLIIE